MSPSKCLYVDVPPWGREFGVCSVGLRRGGGLKLEELAPEALLAVDDARLLRATRCFSVCAVPLNALVKCV